MLPYSVAVYAADAHMGRRGMANTMAVVRSFITALFETMHQASTTDGDMALVPEERMRAWAERARRRVAARAPPQDQLPERRGGSPLLPALQQPLLPPPPAAPSPTSTPTCSAVAAGAALSEGSHLRRRGSPLTASLQ
eukprot:gene28870-58642_t